MQKKMSHPYTHGILAMSIAEKIHHIMEKDF